MNNKGFVFVETIVTVVVLTAVLLTVYSSFSNVVSTEKNRLYYDDMAYVYKTIAIADVLKEQINDARFIPALNDIKNNPVKEKYLYMFNSGSLIYNGEDGVDQSGRVKQIVDLFQVNQLIYIKTSDIKDLKVCLKGNDTSSKCTNTKQLLELFGYTYINDYLLTLDVPEKEGFDAVLISMIYEAKNGGAVNVEGKYEECLQDKIYKYYGIPANSSESTKKNAINRYNNDSTIYFDMQCENAYYISWVYL